MLSLDSIQPDYFTPDHVRLSAAFADQVAVAIENARLYHSLQQNASELATLYRASEQLFGSSQDVTELANRIVQAITREFTDAYCGLRLVDESGNYLGGLVEAGTLLSATAPRPAVPLEGPGLLAAAARSGDVIYAPDVRQDPRYLPSHSNTRSELVVPLRVKSRVIGVLNLESARVDGFDERSRRLIAAFAERAALALENAQLLARLEVARQAAQEASRLKSEFLTNTSHELRTPLTGILGSLDLVIDEMCASPEEERQFLKIARQAGRQLLEMINLLLDLSRIESGKVEVKSAVVDISPLLIEVYLLLQGQAQERHLHLDLHLPAEPFTKVWADPDKVRQIMLNLIGNALKFTEQGQIRVSADADRLEGLMRVDVQDTGIGIPPEQQARLFQPFVQLDGSSTRKYGGTGLGLNIARRLAQMMDGNITLYSAGENQGSTFTLSLPLVQDEQT
jgi:signal transduction histidine kinase